MTIAELIKELERYAKFCGANTEVKVYVGMSKKTAEERLKELTLADEYVFDDFLEIGYLNTFDDGSVYLRAYDIEPCKAESEDKG